MDCPNCKMNIKDDAKFCIHCGANFGGAVNQLVNNNMNQQQVQNTSQPQVQQAPSQNNGPRICPSCGATIKGGNQFCTNCGTDANAQGNNQQPTFTNTFNQQSVSKEARERYYQAYFGNSYDRVKNGGFSIGAFFFNVMWFLLYKLYSRGGDLFLKLFLIALAAGILEGILSPLKGIISTVFSIITFVIEYNYAKEFNYYRMEKADVVIDDICRNYSTEEDRIAMCKRKGGVNIGILVLFILFYALVAFGIFISFTGTVSGTSKVLNNSRRNVMLSDAKTYGNDCSTMVAAGEVAPVKGKITPGKNYYVLINSASNDKYKYPLEFKSGNKYDYGYVLIKAKKEYSDTEYYVCLYSNVDDKHFYYAKGEKDYLERRDVLETDKEGQSVCDVRNTIDGFNAIQLVSNK